LAAPSEQQSFKLAVPQLPPIKQWRMLTLDNSEQQVAFLQSVGSYSNFAIHCVSRLAI
jgi:hypothetical protein